MTDTSDRLLARNIEHAVDRISRLGERTSAIPTEMRPLLQDALHELTALVEELEVTSEELRTQNEQFASTRLTIEEELERFRSLFMHAPISYLVTSPDGHIREANEAAAQLFGLHAQHLRRKLLIAFVPLSERAAFRRSLHDCGKPQPASDPWPLRIRTRAGIEVTIGVHCERLAAGPDPELLWVLSSASAEHGSITAEAKHGSITLADEIVVALHNVNSVDALLNALLQHFVPMVSDFCVVEMPGVGGRRVRCAAMHADAARMDAVAILLADPGLDTGASAVADRVADVIAVRPFGADVLKLLADTPAERQAFSALGLAACLRVPMMSGDTCIGHVTFGWSDAGPGSADYVQDIVDSVSRASVALTRSLDHEARKRTAEAASGSLLSVAHDLRPPVAAILGQIGVLEDREIPEREAGARAPLTSIRHAATLVTAVLDDVLSTATGNSFTHSAEMDAGAIACELMVLMGPSAADRQIVCDVAVPEQPLLFRSDFAKVQRILVNLIADAIELSDSGEVLFTVRAERNGVLFDVSTRRRGDALHQRDEVQEFWGGESVAEAAHALRQSVTRHVAALIGGEYHVDGDSRGSSRFWLPLG